MKIETVGLNSPGDMGQGVAQVLIGNGLRVVAALDGRSERTRQLAAEVGVENVGDLNGLVQQSDVVLSILVPGAAVDAAGKMAEAMRETKRTPLYVDCNAISVNSTKKVGEIVTAAGAPYVDASIIGPPPRVPGKTRFYASGPAVADFQALGAYGLDIRPLGPEVGKASGIKVCYASFTKATTALATELLVSAKRMGLLDNLMQELSTSQKALLGYAQQGLERMPPKAHRWIAEMEELAATYQGLGLTPRILAGAADMYRDISQTRLGLETPEEQRQHDRSFEEIIGMLEEDLPRG